MAELEFFYVAFIDVLGFAEMVRSDCQAPTGTESNLRKLHKVHQSTKDSLGAGDYQLVQFSDSVVLNRRFEKNALDNFLRAVQSYQRDLFLEGLLCRGGVAYGKHFLEEDFLFSAGLVEAYRIERDVARFPRIVVSTDLIDLVLPNHSEELPLLRGDDGAVFIDFLRGVDTSRATEIIRDALERARDPRVREKVLWLCRYHEFLTGVSSNAPPAFMEWN